MGAPETNDRTKEPEIVADQAASADPPRDSSREELHRLINELPSQQVEAARNLLRWLIHESLREQFASDAAVDEAGDAFINQYRGALERLAR